MEIRKCATCQEQLPVTSFNVKKLTKAGNPNYQSACKACGSPYRKEHYLANTEYYKAKARAKDEKQHIKYKEYKSTLSCARCGVAFKGQECICDFHHVDSATKDFTPSTIRLGSWSKLLKELEKCVPLCSNCHRIEHQRNGL